MYKLYSIKFGVGNEKTNIEINPLPLAPITDSLKKSYFPFELVKYRNSGEQMKRIMVWLEEKEINQMYEAPLIFYNNLMSGKMLLR